MSTSVTQIYRLRSQGQFDVQCVKQCLSLFKANAVNIRKMILLKETHPTHFSHLEIDFMLIEAEETGQAFLDSLAQGFTGLPQVNYSVFCVDSPQMPQQLGV